AMGNWQWVRKALAQMCEPELVVLDEPMTGLDPLERKEIRDLIIELRHEGRTVFFSTHILPDVEMTCDRVAMIFAGKIRSVGPLSQLMAARQLSTEVFLHPGPGGAPALPEGARKHDTPDGLSID